MSVRQFIFVLKLLALIQGGFLLSHDYPTNRAVKYSTDTSGNASDYRLPGNLMPTSYDLTLQPFLDNSTFNGWVTINFVVTNATDSIVLNIHKSSINLINTAISAESRTLTVSNTTIDDVHEMVTFSLNETLAIQSSVRIDIVYSGVLREDMLGFYISTYHTSSGLQKMAITQFESTNARRAFPCFDEPAYRATFNINIIRMQNQNSLANMPLLSSDPYNTTGWFLDTYNTTPAMPTYLVAFGVSELSQVNNSNSFRIYTRESTLPDSTYLLSVGQTILDTIGTYLSLTYPLPKMDVVAVPDFNAGAMENWGLTTYREKYVLWNSTLNTLKDRFGVLSVNAHEFAHQWFGDLVTPAWWEYAWLNEAFATFFEYTIPNLVSPDWDVGSTEFVISAQTALGSDVGSPRPMTAPVATPAQIENVFDYVIYDKGGAILRMIENFLTTDVWKAGLNQYLNTNAYKTGTPEELFSALEAAADASFLTVDNLNQTLMQWTTQAGFPLITITHSDSKITNITSTQYTITQVPYNLDNSSTSTLWNVPLRYTTEFDKEFDPTNASLHWFYPSVESSSSLTVNHSGWVIFNIDQTGFYRVNYDIDNWIKLKAQLDSNWTEISDINRAQILDDALHLARTGHLNYSTALGLTEYLVNETNPAPWNAFINNFKYLINQFYGTSTGNGLEMWAKDLMRNLQSNLDVSTYKRSLTTLMVSQFGCDIGISDWESYSSMTFKNWINNNTALVTPELKQAVICTGLRLDSLGSAFADVWKYFLNSNNAAEQLLMLNAMGCVSNEQAIQTYLDAVCDVTSNYVRLQDRWIAFRALLSRQTGVLPGLKYIASNYENVSTALGTDFSGVFSYMANTISQDAHITEVRNMIANTALDQRFRSSLNTTVLPAVLKRQAWAESTPGQSLKTWVEANVNSSAVSVFINVCLTVSAIFVLNMV